MNEFVTALHRELSALEAELTADPRYQKLAKIRELLGIYKVADTPAPIGPSLAAELPTETASKAERIRAETRAFIERSGGVAHRHDILRHLLQLGIMGKERQPMASFAAYLSEMKEFESVGNGKWTVRANASASGTQRRKVVQKHIAGSASAQIEEFAIRYIRAKGARAQAPEIVDAMQGQGMNFRADTVSSNLSHSPIFDNVRGEGYGLAEWKDRTPTETPNSGQLFGAPRSNGVEPLNA
jgi:hypothetical protein